MEESYKLCNRLFHGCGIAGMQLLDADSIPLVVTSPPYGSIRDYGGHSFYFKPMASELWRVVMPGGIVCWHVQDQIADGAESGESIRQCLYFLDLGFRLHTTLTVEGNVTAKHRNRYGQPVQHVFVFSKDKPQTFNPIKDVPNLEPGKIRTHGGRVIDGTTRVGQTVRTKPFRKRGVHWKFSVGSHNTPDRMAREHPALMPELLARDLIMSWSNQGDLVLDPMSGAGTTAKMAFLNNRRFLGFEINREYHDLAVERMEMTVESTLESSNKLRHKIPKEELSIRKELT